MKIPRTHSFRTVPVALALFAAAACTKHQTAATGQEATIVKSGPAAARAELQFNFQAMTEILISVADPVTGNGENFTARIARRPDPRRPGNDAWWITAGPEGRTLSDHRANDAFLLHTFDTLRTAQLAQIPGDASEPSFGLVHPFYTIQWEAEGIRRELRLGAPARDKEGNFTGLFARIVQPEAPGVFVLTGAFLNMLSMVKNFDSLRLPTLATFPADEVDELKIDARGKPAFFAQREGDQWKNDKRKPTRADVGAFLQQITHLRIQRFIDDEEENAQLLKQVMSRPLYTLRFQPDLKKQPVSMQFAKADDRVFATISTRPAEPRWPETANAARPPLAVFEVFPQVLGEIASEVSGKTKPPPL